ncbi:hypothetical protein VTN31DRAFT_1191 [Thermomyces dupontii]|uniref:uncharacterized protein n=1 Tax=Talaromyces thermophilus TaxID=28565 RepID=UPI003743A53C
MLSLARCPRRCGGYIEASASKPGSIDRMSGFPCAPGRAGSGSCPGPGDSAQSARRDSACGGWSAGRRLIQSTGMNQSTTFLSGGKADPRNVEPRILIRNHGDIYIPYTEIFSLPLIPRIPEDDSDRNQLNSRRFARFTLDIPAKSLQALSFRNSSAQACLLRYAARS